MADTPNPPNDDQAPTTSGTPAPTSLPSLFHFGHVVATPGALRKLEELGVSPFALLCRHVVADWGDLCEEDKQANIAAVESGGRIFSSYKLSRTENGQRIEAKIWIITEGTDGSIGGVRAYTTVLLPDEY